MEQSPDNRDALTNAILKCAARKYTMNDDIERLLAEYSDDDLLTLNQITSIDNGDRRMYQFRQDVLGMILEDDVSMVRIAAHHVDDIRRGRTALGDLILIVGGLREIGAMTSEDERNPALPAHFAMFRTVELDRRLPYHLNDELMLTVQEFYPRLDDIRRYRMERGDDTEGLRAFMSTPSRVLEDGVL